MSVLPKIIVVVLAFLLLSACGLDSSEDSKHADLPRLDYSPDHTPEFNWEEMADPGKAELERLRQEVADKEELLHRRNEIRELRSRLADLDRCEAELNEGPRGRTPTLEELQRVAHCRQLGAEPESNRNREAE